MSVYQCLGDSGLNLKISAAEKGRLMCIFVNDMYIRASTEDKWTTIAMT